MAKGLRWSSDKSVLIVDDENAFAETLAAILRDRGLSVRVASGGAAAKSILSLEKFDLIISDIRMPGLNGIELLHYVKRETNTPVALMTGFSEITEAKEAFEMGAVGFLPKPFKRDELLELVEKVVGAPATAPAPALPRDDSFVGLRIEDFISGREILFDIYIRLSAEKYIKVAAGGDSIDIERTLKFKEKGITHLYLTKEDFRKYVGFASNLVQKVVESKVIEGPRKLQYLTQTSATLLKEMYHESIDESAYSAASELVLVTVGVLGEQDEALSLLDALEKHSDYLYKHSIAVSLYSVLIAKAYGWNSPRTVVRLGICGFMHDIGKKEIPAEILQKSRIQLNADEIRLLETHARRGMEILSKLPGIPEEVPLVALQHHENNLASGYPSHLSKNKIMPISRLVALANAFCELILKGPGYEGMSPENALQVIALNHQGMYDEDYIKALHGLFKVPYRDKSKLAP